MKINNTKNYNGFEVSNEDYDDLIKNYYFISDLHADLVLEIRNISFGYIKSTIKAIDEFILNIEYEPEVSHEDLKYIAIQFYTCKLAKEAFDNDFEQLEQSLEVVCGIMCKFKQNIVFQMIDLCMKQINQLTKLLCH